MLELLIILNVKKMPIEKPFSLDYDEEMDCLAREIENLEIKNKSNNVSVYQPSSQESSSTEQSSHESYDIDDTNEEGIVSPLDKFLQHANLQPLGSVLTRPWDTVSKKTQLHYRRKTSKIIAEILRIVAPESASSLWSAIKKDDDVMEQLEDPKLDDDFLLALAESYKQASKPDTRRQLLSLIAGKISHTQLSKYIPDVTRYQYTAARKYTREVGADFAINQSQQHRTKVDITKVEHFIDFITASNILQDLPFGRKILKLSNNEKIEIPHVIRTLIPSRLIAQYNEFCKENCYIPLSKSTLFQILSESCPASVRKSLQGLDNYVAEGGRAFDDLISLMDTLLKYGAPKSTVQGIKEKLKLLKQYLKGDYKVISICYTCKRWTSSIS